MKARSSPLSHEHKLSSVESDGEKKSERKHHASSNPKRDKKEKGSSHERSPSKDPKDKKHKDTKKGSDRATDGKGEKTEKHVHCFVRYHFQGPRKCAICEELVWYVP